MFFKSMRQYDIWRKPFRTFKNRYRRRRYVRKVKKVYKPRVYSYEQKKRFRKQLDDMFMHQAEGDLEGLGILRRKYWDDYNKKKLSYKH